MSAHVHAQRGPSDPLIGVGNARRLQAVREAELIGHLGDLGLDAVVATLGLACTVPMAVVNIVTPNQQTYPAEIGVGAPCTSVPDELSFCAEVVNTGRAMAVSNASTHPVYSGNPMVQSGAICSYAGVPLLDDGVVLGSVSIFDSHEREFTHDELRILEHQTQLAASVLALRRSARTDVLTGLPNRRLYHERLVRALGRMARNEGAAAVMYVDIDHFKGINDTFGHDAGDWVLTHLADRLTVALRTTDTLARFGGDEFVAVCEGLNGTGEVAVLAARVVRAMNQTWVREGETIPVEVSIGIALADSPHSDPSELLHNADAAMYRAKKLPGSHWVLAAEQLAARP